MQNSKFNRKMRLVSPAHSSYLLTRLQGTESISELYDFEIELQLPHHLPANIFDTLGDELRVEVELPTPSWLMATVTGQLPAPKVRRFCGLSYSATELYEDDHYRYFQLRFAPRLWLLTKRVNCRIFQEMTVPAIIQAVCNGLNLRMGLRDNYPKRPYCVQYNESDYTFVKRLAEEEGIFFYFEQEYAGQDDPERPLGERLVFVDSVTSLPTTQSNHLFVNAIGERVPGTLKYDSGDGGTREELRVHKWHKSQSIVSSKCTVRDQHFQLPEQTLEASEQLAESIRIENYSHRLHVTPEELEQFYYPGEYAKYFDGIQPGGGERPEAIRAVFTRNNEAAKSNVDRIAAECITIVGDSNCIHLSAAEKFSLDKSGSLSGPYLIKSITHTARLNADYRTGSVATDDNVDDLSYENTFECQAEAQPYAPPKQTLKPRIYGFQTATVVTPEQVEVSSDQFGRIKVRFNWDRRGDEEARSSWIRVSQIWAGNRWGAFFWPRAGHEVVVAFEHGDPDRPLVIGSVYNARNLPPLQLPARLLSNGIKSCTAGGNPLENYSCVVFHDAPDREYLQLHSETHECLTSEKAKLSSTTGPEVKLHGGSWDLLGLFGSGAGGGPSSRKEPTPSPQTEISAEAPWIADMFEPHIFESLIRMAEQGSGSGGLISSVLIGSGALGRMRGSRAGAAASTAGVDNLQGGIAVTSGAKLNINLGASKTNSFASDVSVTADMEGLVESLLMAAANLAYSGNTDVLKWNMGGWLCQVYGNKKNITYGHISDIHRGSKTTVTAKHFFSKFLPSDLAESYENYLNANTAFCVNVTAILLVLFNLAMAIAVKVEMENPHEKQSSEENDKENLQSWKETIDRIGKWNSRGESILLFILSCLETLQAELTRIGSAINNQEKSFSDTVKLSLRMGSWSKLGPGVRASANDATKWQKSIAGILVVVAAGLLLVGSGFAAAKEFKE